MTGQPGVLKNLEAPLPLQLLDVTMVSMMSLRNVPYVLLTTMCRPVIKVVIDVCGR